MYRMGYVCRHDEHLTLRKTINVLCDVNFRLPVQYLTYGIERRGMLAQLLSLVEREKREVTRPVMDELLTYDTAFGILDFSLGENGLSSIPIFSSRYIKCNKSQNNKSLPK